MSKTEKSPYNNFKAFYTLPGKERPLQLCLYNICNQIFDLYSINADSIVYFLYVHTIRFTDCLNIGKRDIGQTRSFAKTNFMNMIFCNVNIAF